MVRTDDALETEAARSGSPHHDDNHDAVLTDARRWRLFVGAADLDPNPLHANARRVIEQLADSVALGTDPDRAMALLEACEAQIRRFCGPDDGPA